MLTQSAQHLNIFSESPSATNSRSLEAVTLYLAAWKALANRRPEVRGIARDLCRCAEINIFRSTAFADHDRTASVFKCKRPACLKCAPAKNAHTQNRLERFCATSEAPNVVGGSFEASVVTFPLVRETVDDAIDIWSRVIRSTYFKGSVKAWARTVEVVPNFEKSEVVVRINLLLMLHKGGVKPIREAEFYAIGGLFSRYGWRPVRCDHIEPSSIEPTTRLARSGFDASALSAGGSCNLIPLPEALWQLHTGLHGRRLVAFGGGSSPA